MAIYTRKGDKGLTSLFDGKKIGKDNFQVETYGTIDELNSILGVASSFSRTRIIKKEVEIIQNDLLEIGSSLAVTTPLPVDQLKKRAKEFEDSIDMLTQKMPPLKNFILPGGSKGSSYFHLARTVARRAERRVVTLSKKKKIDEVILVYLNRLSDLLFTFARYENWKQKEKERIWKKR